MAVDLLTKRVTPRVPLDKALNSQQDVLRAFEALQSDVILLAELLQASMAESEAMKARLHALDGQ